METKSIDFYSDTLLGIKDATGKVWLAIRKTCRDIGLTEHQADRQRDNIKNDLALSKGYSNLSVPTNEGTQKVFHNGKALIAHAGIDAPPYQSGQFTGTQRKISKRGSASLRKIGYEVMRCLKTHKTPEDGAVYEIILKKEREGKSKRAAKIARLNKFLRIYYARVMEVYQQ